MTLQTKEMHDKVSDIWEDFNKQFMLGRVFCRKPKPKVLDLGPGSGDIVVKEASQPSDILWQNMGISFKEKTKARLFSLFVTITLIGVCFTVVSLLKSYQADFL